MTYPSIPTGLRGALRRSGSQAHEPNFYKLLHRLLDQPAHPTISRVLGRLSDLDFDKLRIVETIRQEVCTAALVEAVKSPARAEDINTGIDLLSASGVDRRALIDALRGVANAKALAALWTRWMRQTVFPPHPIPASLTYTPVPDAAALRTLSLRYRNCSERYVIGVLNGVDHFAEFQHEERKVVVHLRRRREVWELEGVFCKHNARPSPAMRQAVIAHLAQHAIAPKTPSFRQVGNWDVLERLSQPTLFHFEHEFN